MVELMIVLTIAFVFLTMAVPGFSALSGRVRATTELNDFVAAVRAARSEALGRGIRIDMVPNDGLQWNSGWTVFVDADGDQAWDEAEEIVLTRGALSRDTAIDGGSDGNAFYDGIARKRYLAFTASGYPRRNGGASAMDSLVLHNKYVRRKLALNFLGRIRTCNPDADKNC